MAKKAREKEEDVDSYRHEAESRKNAFSAGHASCDTAKHKPNKYEYSPHLDPQLAWSGKKEHTSFAVPTVSLHIHERIAQVAIIRSIKNL